MKNKELKLYAASKDVRLWQIAEKFGITYAAFSRKLRKEFSKEDAEQFKMYVDEITSEGGGIESVMSMASFEIAKKIIKCPQCGKEINLKE